MPSTSYSGNSYQTAYFTKNTLVLVLHSLALDERHNRIPCLIGRVEGQVAGGVVDPVDFEVRVDIEIVPDFLVAHVVDPKQVPAARSDLYAA